VEGLGTAWAGRVHWLGLGLTRAWTRAGPTPWQVFCLGTACACVCAWGLEVLSLARAMPVPGQLLGHGSSWARSGPGPGPGQGLARVLVRTFAWAGHRQDPCWAGLRQASIKAWFRQGLVQAGPVPEEAVRLGMTCAFFWAWAGPVTYQVQGLARIWAKAGQGLGQGRAGPVPVQSQRPGQGLGLVRAGPGQCLILGRA
jgi:hypothetical protein